MFQDQQILGKTFGRHMKKQKKLKKETEKDITLNQTRSLNLKMKQFV